MIHGARVGIPLDFPISMWRKALPLLPRYLKGSLQYHSSLKEKPTRTLHFPSEIPMYEGAFGSLYKALRTCEKGGEKEVLVKRPKITTDCLLSEALVQHYVYSVFTSKGFGAHIPEVYDIVRDEKEVWFSMEHSNGTPLITWLLGRETPELEFAVVLAQLAIILELLHTSCNIDHRDMKGDNIVVVDRNSSVILSGRVYHFPFTLVLLDFGFSCVAQLDISKGAYPALDPCPKEGRDMFHLLASLWSIPELRERLSPMWSDWIHRHLLSNNIHYTELAERVRSNDWIYLLSGKENFRSPSCLPGQILLDLCADEWLH